MIEFVGNTPRLSRLRGRSRARTADPAERRARRIGLAQRFALRALSLAILLGAWWLVAELDVWSDLFVPDPSAVWGRFVDSVTVHDGQEGLSGYYLWDHLWASLWRILRGVGWAIVLGVPLGLLLATVKPFQVVVEPYVNFVRALPPLAYFSLLIIWFGVVFQQPNLYPWMSVLDNVALGPRLAGARRAARHAIARRTALFITHSVEEAVYLGTRIVVMSPRPGRIVFDERVPFDEDARRPSLRATPGFVAFRQRVSEQIGAS